MSVQQSFNAPTVKAKKPTPNPPSVTNPGHSGPTTFFLRNDKDMEELRNGQLRGRKLSKESKSCSGGSTFDGSQRTQMTTQSSSMADSNFGVESLEEAIGSAFDASEESSLSRTDSNLSSSHETEAGAEGLKPNSRKRKAGNPVHPKIQAAGQRIISSELPSTRTSPTASPVSYRSSESPFRGHLRRDSAASSVNMSQPLTPLRLSPHPESGGLPGTPRSGSPKSFRLSDEEMSVKDETGSQAVASSSDEDEYEPRVTRGECSMPQLVMPSITMPARRPFTDCGKSMGRLKVMVIGPAGVGKTSFINSVLRTCEDVVHVDHVPDSSLGQSMRSSETQLEATKRITEITASTKPYPVWWSEMEKSQSSMRRKSVVEGALDRNLCFVDTPGVDSDESVQPLVSYMQRMLRRSVDLDTMSETEILGLLSGEGGVQVDAVLYLFGPAHESSLEPAEEGLLRHLSKWTNLVPVIARADEITSKHEVVYRKRNVVELLQAAEIPTFERRTFQEAQEGDEVESWRRIMDVEPLAVSSALSNDTDTMDASTLMSSQYVQPLVTSDLQTMIAWLFDPVNIARLRHSSAKKLVSWRRENLHMLSKHASTTIRSYNRDLNMANQSSVFPSSDHDLPDPSKVLVPHSDSSFYRSISSSRPHSPDPTTALAHYNSRTYPPGEQILHTAKWAQDLQRGVLADRARYRDYYNPYHSQGSTKHDTSPEKPETALTPRPAAGHLGGDISLLGPLESHNLQSLLRSFRRTGFWALKLASGLAVLGPLLYWVSRNWAEVQDGLGFGNGGGMISVVPAVPAPGMKGDDWVEWVGEGWRWVGGLVGEVLGV
ncbi:hypothetical protein MBLNU230_g2610t1 [Neophaeotheca triangularis]